MTILLEGEVMRHQKTGAKAVVTMNLGSRRDRHGILCQKLQVRIYEAKAHYKVGDYTVWSAPLEEEES